MRRRMFLAIFIAVHGLAASGVESVGMTVSDLDRSVEFYTKVLTFQAVSRSEVADTGRRARLRLGGEFLELTQYHAPGRAAPVDSRSHDRWFQHVAIIVRDMDRAYEILRGNHVEPVSQGPQRLPDWNPNAGGIQAFYFRDPDGHPLEILSFPPEKGDRKWHEATDKLFLGIDHTAIVISNTDASLRFYRDDLGLHVAGESENYGVEQERLNNVSGARLRITALRGEAGPGIEFLEYLAPRDGRPFPADEKANDLVHWQTRVQVPSLPAAVSTGVVELPRAVDAIRQSVIVRDPDGHAVELTVR
jgi:catechol 2,3-dioxygenase-like lactoylglutathione lyase family enzyme